MNKNIKKISIVGILATAAAVVFAVAAPDVYVAPNGNDANACTVTQPCKTIARGIAKASPGQVVSVAAGVYKENVNVNKPITLLGNGAVIDGTGLPVQNGGGLINIPATVTGATVQGFEVQNGGTYGISVFGNENKIIGNTIHHIKSVGIWMRDGKFNLFENNELYFSVLENSVSFDGARYVCNPNNTTGWASAINPWGAASNNTWRGNYVHDNCGEGIVLYNGDIAEGNTFRDNWSVEIYIDAHTDVIVRNNKVSNTRPYFVRGSNQAWRQVPYGIAIADENGCVADRNTVTGNTVENVRFGFSFYSYSACSGLKNTVVANNTFINTWEYAIRITPGPHVNAVVQNNTVSSPNGSPYTVPANVTMIGNNFGNMTSTVVVVPSSTVTKTVTRTPIISPVTMTLVPVTRTPIPTVCVPAYKLCLVPMP